MSTVSTDHFPAWIPPPDADPFRYGWRYVKRRDKEGNPVHEQIPLTLEDVLHPQEDDFIVNNTWHDLIRGYLRDAARAYFAGRSDVVLISDCRVDWGSKYGWIHGPDWALFTGNQTPWSISKGTFPLKKHKAKIECAIEVASASTRSNDFVDKVREYYLVGVPYYLIIDLPEDLATPIRLYGFKAGSKQYVPLALNDKGRLPLGETGLLLGVEGTNVFLEDPAGRRLPSFEEWKNLAESAEERAEQERKRAEREAQRAEQEKQRAETERNRAEEAEKLAQAEQASRRDLETRLRALEEELARRESSQ